MADAVDDEFVERAGLRLYRRKARRRMRHELGDHRIIINRNLTAFENAGVIAQGHAVFAFLLGRTVFDEPPG